MRLEVDVWVVLLFLRGVGRKVAHRLQQLLPAVLFSWCIPAVRCSYSVG